MMAELQSPCDPARAHDRKVGTGSQEDSKRGP